MARVPQFIPPLSARHASGRVEPERVSGVGPGTVERRTDGSAPAGTRGGCEGCAGGCSQGDVEKRWVGEGAAGTARTPPVGRRPVPSPPICPETRSSSQECRVDSKFDRLDRTLLPCAMAPRIKDTSGLTREMRVGIRGPTPPDTRFGPQTKRPVELATPPAAGPTRVRPGRGTPCSRARSVLPAPLAPASAGSSCPAPCSDEDPCMDDILSPGDFLQWRFRSETFLGGLSALAAKDSDKSDCWIKRVESRWGPSWQTEIDYFPRLLKFVFLNGLMGGLKEALLAVTCGDLREVGALVAAAFRGCTWATGVKPYFVFRKHPEVTAGGTVSSAPIEKSQADGFAPYAGFEVRESLHDDAATSYDPFGPADGWTATQNQGVLPFAARSRQDVQALVGAAGDDYPVPATPPGVIQYATDAVPPAYVPDPTLAAPFEAMEEYPQPLRESLAYQPFDPAAACPWQDELEDFSYKCKPCEDGNDWTTVPVGLWWPPYFMDPYLPAGSAGSPFPNDRLPGLWFYWTWWETEPGGHPFVLGTIPPSGSNWTEVLLHRSFFEGLQTLPGTPYSADSPCIWDPDTLFPLLRALLRFAGLRDFEVAVICKLLGIWPSWMGKPNTPGPIWNVPGPAWIGFQESVFGPLSARHGEYRPAVLKQALQDDPTLTDTADCWGASMEALRTNLFDWKPRTGRVFLASTGEELTGDGGCLDWRDFLWPIHHTNASAAVAPAELAPVQRPVASDGSPLTRPKGWAGWTP